MVLSPPARASTGVVHFPEDHVDGEKQEQVVLVGADRLPAERSSDIGSSFEHFRSPTTAGRIERTPLFPGCASD